MIPAFPESFRFDRFQRDGETFGRIAELVEWQTEITGYHVKIQDYVIVSGVKLWINIELFSDGRLYAQPLTEYDFGSGPAINNLPVIYASLLHDIICHLTNLRHIDWKWRRWGDAAYRRALKFYGAPWWRRYAQWSGVGAYSQLIARWRDKR